MSDQELVEHVSFTFDTIELWQDGRCAGFPPHHTTLCTNQTQDDVYCACLADAANQCVAAHDPHYWKFTACMFARNGSPFSASGLEVDDTFATTVEECAGTLANYSVEDLKTCYGGFEGFNYIQQSEQASADWGAATPQWMYVNGVYVNSTAYGDFTAWAEAVKAKICEDIDGIKPASCLTVHV